MSLTARQYFNKALELMGGLSTRINLIDPHTRKRLLTVASYLQLATEKACEPFPEANARLSFVLFVLGESSQAKDQANYAINICPYMFWARLALHGLAWIELLSYNPYIDNTSSAGTIVTAGMAMVGRAGKTGRVRRTAREVATAFIDTVKNDFLQSNEINVESYLLMGETLLDIADDFRQGGMKEPLLYRVILQVPWESIGSGSFAEEVVDLRARAEGLLHI